MKKILFVLALFASMQFAGAQAKSEAAAKAAVDAAKVAADNAKKATKVATWTKLGQAYLDAFNAPTNSVWVGAGRQEIQLLLGNKKPVSSEAVTLNGQQYTKDSYSNCDFYYNANNQLAFTNVTQPVVDNALDNALAAYQKAYAVDTKASKTKDITEAIKSIATKYADEAYAAYSMGDLAKASKLFESAASASAVAPLSAIDTNSIYNAAFTAYVGGDYNRAKNFFEKSVSYGYYGDDGDAFAKLADIADKAGDKEGSKAILEKGFESYPESQSILIGLINYYIGSGENTDRLFELLDNAKQNEPNNASLYYVEGNIHKQLGDVESAAKAYNQCATIDPNYEYGFIGAGILFYDKAVEIQEAAQAELDDTKYQALVEEFVSTLKNCIEPFEKAFAVTKDDEVKVSISEYLKNVYYRFRDESSSYMTNYEKYANIVATGVVE